MLGWIAAQAIVGPPPYDHYASHFWPLLALGIGGLVAELPNPAVVRQRVNIIFMFAVVLLGSNLYMYLSQDYPFLLSYSVEQTAEIAYIRQYLPKDTVVMGHVPDFYLLRDYPNYLTYRDGDAYGVQLRGETQLSFWQRVAPQAILLDIDQLDEDPALLQYLLAGEFEQVRPALWLAEGLNE